LLPFAKKLSVNKLAQILREEASPLPLRLQWAGWLMSGWPLGAGVRARVRLYRAAGLAIGPGTLISGPIQFGMTGNPCRSLTIGAGCFLNSPLFVDAAAKVTIGDSVSLGHHVVIVTSSHALGASEFRAGALQTAPVTIEDGAWIAAGVTLLPGVTVGRGAVVAAGAVVTKDVAPNTLVGGIPAKLIRMLGPE
jgi:maltose O-acetyltransferase